MPSVSVIGDVRQIASRQELLSNLTTRELRGKYKGTVLGWVWSYLQPAIRFCMFYFLFQVMIGRGSSMENFAIHLFAGW